MADESFEVQLARSVATIVRTALAPIRERLTAIEGRIASMESKGGFRYRGVFDEREQYNLGDFCTAGGSLWHANRSTRSRPGADGSWTLAVKHGKDAR